MKPLLKRILAVLAVAGLLLVVVLVAAFVYLNSAAFRRLLIDKVDEAIAGQIEMTDHRIALFPGRLTLNGLELIGTDGETVASIEQLDLSVFWPALVRRTLHISRLTIDTLFLTLEYDRSDQLNLNRALASKSDRPAASDESAKPDFHIKLDDFRLINGSIQFERPAMGVSVRAERLDLSGYGDSRHPSGHLTAAFGTLRVHTPDSDQILRDVSVSADYNALSPEPLAIAVETPDSSVMVQGRIDWQDDDLQVTLAGDLDIDLAQIQLWLPADLDLSGQVKGRFTMAGEPADPLISVLMEWTAGTVWALDVQRLTLDARLEARQVSLAGLGVRSHWGELDLTGALDLRPLFPESFEQRVADFETLIYQFDLKARQVIPDRLRAFDFPPGGTWESRILLEGVGMPHEQGQGRAQLQLRGDDLVLIQGAQRTGGELSAEARWNEGRIEITRSQARLSDHRINAAGRIDLQREHLEVSGQVHSPQINDLGRLLGIDLPTGDASLEFSGKGPWDKPAGNFVFLARGLAWEAWRFGQLAVEADLDAEGVLHITRVALENQGSRLEGAGRLDLFEPDGSVREDPPLNLTLDLGPLELVHFNADQDVNVRLSGDLRVAGTAGNPTADLKITPSMVDWAARSVMVQALMRWEAGDLTVSELRLSKDQSVLDLQGEVQLLDAETGQWTSDPRVRAAVTGSTIQLEDFLPDYRGVLKLQADAAGRISDLNGTFRLDGSEMDLAVQTLDSLRLEGRLIPGAVHVDQLLVVVAPGQEVQGSGRYGFDEHFEAVVRTAGVELRHIDTLAEGPALGGSLTFEVDAHGTVQHPEVTGRIGVRDPRLEGQQWDDFTARVELKGRRLDVDADLNFKITGHATLDSGDFDVTADFEQTNLDPYLALLVDAQWGGLLSGRVRATGNWQDFSTVAGDLVLTDAHLRYQEIRLLTMDRLEARLANGKLDLPLTRLAWMQDGYLTVAAAGDIQRNLMLQADGRLPLAALAPFSDAIDEAVGDVRIAAQGSGPLTDFSWNADLILDNIGFYLPDMDQSVRAVNGRVQFTSEQVTMRKLGGMLDGGRFVLDGRVGLDDLQPTGGKLTITLTGLPVQVPDTMDARINADLVLTGDGRRARLEGNVVLLEGAYYRDLRLNLLSVITQTQRVARSEPIADIDPPPEWMEAIDLDITLTHRYPFLVDNNVARLEIVPDLRISGTAARPVLDGRAAVPDGEVFFRRQTFRVTRGVVDFIHPYRIEPTLDIAAEAQIRQWLVSLSIKGTLEDLAITLRSNPPESDSNILSLILLGRTSDELTRDSGSATTSQMLASLVESAWGEDIRRGIGVDILEVETGPQPNGENEERIQVTVGKRVSPRLTIKYEVETGTGETVQRAISEYRLLERLLASGFQDTLGVYGGELLFRIEFR